MNYPIKPLPPVELPELRQVGKPLRKVDAMGKAVGATVYAGDFSMPRMLHAKVFRSSQVSAKIVRLDVSKARQLPGVACVLTGVDVPNARLVSDMPGQTGQKQRKGSDVPVLSSEVVRFYGEPIALVAAETLEIAAKALQLIEIEYEPLPGVYDPLEAMKPGAPVVYAPDNLVSHWKIHKGNVSDGLAQADLIVENTFRVPFQEHAYLEPEAGVAWIDEQGVITIRVSTQVVEHFRSIARAVGVPQNRIRIQGTMVGGGFGGKEDITVEIYLALLAKHTSRPVKLVYTREESFLAHSKRHPFMIRHHTGVKKDGRITASRIEMISDSGAYPYLSPYVLLYAAVMAPGPYRIDNLLVDAYSVATNNPFTSAFRGFGGPQACFAYEQQMDAIADELGLDPLEVRRVNYLRVGDRTSTGQIIAGAAWLEETATRAAAALGEKTPNQGSIKVGQGFASYFQSYGRITWLHDTSQAWVGLELDGTVTIRSGVPDIGGGQANSLCQIAAEVLGVPLEKVSIYCTDSALTPLAGTTTATRQLYMSGNAALLASTNVRKVLLDRASKHFEEEMDKLDIADSKVFVKSDPSQSIDLTDLIKLCAAEGLHLSNLGIFRAPFTTPIDPETGQGQVFPDFTFGAFAVEVAVDTETGEYTILKAVSCHDAGRAINRATVEGQMVGGGVQGLGYATIEDLIVKEGVIQTPSLSEYLVPTSMDFPPIQAIILESGTGVGPFGAKGIGEPSLTPAAPAFARAVADAIGVRINEIPITPGKIVAALNHDKVGASR
ncbi:MAG: xanthine dehydrogenase family protein [Caldilineaceae bacterium]|nr:xanthine dehydrogenase family protein [Caldilineaceae bacterium]